MTTCQVGQWTSQMLRCVLIYRMWIELAFVVSTIIMLSLRNRELHARNEDDDDDYLYIITSLQTYFCVLMTCLRDFCC